MGGLALTLHVTREHAREYKSAAPSGGKNKRNSRAVDIGAGWWALNHIFTLTIAGPIMYTPSLRQQTIDLSQSLTLTGAR
jgi:hypothetical protein